MTKIDQKSEAIKRMEKLGLMKSVIGSFARDNKVYYSERQNQMFSAVLYWLDNSEEYTKLVSDFEKEHGALVYHAILTHTQFGDVLDLLYVSKYEDEWEMDNEDISDGYTFVYSNNLSDNSCSEFGSIAVKSAMGGLERVG